MEMKNAEPIYIAGTKFGNGVFATRDIGNGELICVMVGKKITAKQLDRITKKNRNILVDPLQIAEDAYIDLDIPYLYINHSCDPNAGLRNSVMLFAIKPIKKDKEIFYDYSTTWFDGFDCACGSKLCRKHISDFYTIPPKVRTKYKRLNIIPDFIKQ